MSEQRRDKDSRVDTCFSKEKLVYFMNPTYILSTGSAPHNFSDMLVVGAATRQEYLDAFMRLNPLDAETIQLVDDAAIIHTQGQDRVGIAYYRLGDFEQHTQRLAIGQSVEPIHTTWSMGPWLPESFAADLARALVVHDNMNNLDDILSQFRDYPDELQQAILAYTEREIVLKSELINRDTVTSFSRSLLANDITTALLRQIYASEKIYFRGAKFIDETKDGLSFQAQQRIAKLLE